MTRRARIGIIPALLLSTLALMAVASPAAVGQQPASATPGARFAATSKTGSTVGMPAKIDQLVIDGPELEVKPIEDRRAPFVLRIVEAYPHGSAFRYDLIYYGLEPGQYDLKDYLRRKDGSAVDNLPSVVVKVDPILPPGQIEPNAMPLESSPWLGGYRLLMAFLGSLWCAGLAAILLLGRKKAHLEEAAHARPLTLAEKLKPLVDRAVAGTLSESQYAELERLLIGYWRTRLKLEDASPSEVIRLMRNHPEAGPLFRKLEEWLHKPGARAEAVDVAELLRPYQYLPADGADDGDGESPVPAMMAASKEPHR